MEADLIAYLYPSGLVRQSVQAIRPDLPRWVKRLRERGVTEIPKLGRCSWSPSEARAHNEINLLIRQAGLVRDQAFEHPLRNLTGARPFKP